MVLSRNDFLWTLIYGWLALPDCYDFMIDSSVNKVLGCVEGTITAIISCRMADSSNFFDTSFFHIARSCLQYSERFQSINNLMKPT